MSNNVIRNGECGRKIQKHPPVYGWQHSRHNRNSSSAVWIKFPSKYQGESGADNSYRRWQAVQPQKARGRWPILSVTYTTKTCSATRRTHQYFGKTFSRSSEIRVKHGLPHILRGHERKAAKTNMGTWEEEITGGWRKLHCWLSQQYEPLSTTITIT